MTDEEVERMLEGFRSTYPKTIEALEGLRVAVASGEQYRIVGALALASEAVAEEAPKDPDTARRQAWLQAWLETNAAYGGRNDQA